MQTKHTDKRGFTLTNPYNHLVWLVELAVIEFALPNGLQLYNIIIYNLDIQNKLMGQV